MTDSEPDPDGKRDARDAHVQVLTAEVRTLVVGSRQVTMSVYNQPDEVDPDDIQPFGRVRPRGGDDYIWLVGRHEASGALVRAKIPASGEAIAREAGFSDLEHSRLCGEADKADKAAANYETKGNVTLYFGDGSSGTGLELAARYREQARRLRESARTMHEKFLADAKPYWLRREDAEELPLVVLAGLR